MDTVREQRQRGSASERNCSRAKRNGGAAHPPDHGNPNRPRRIADREAEIRVIGSLVLTLLHVVYNLC
jgi:hypothetical protein